MSRIGRLVSKLRGKSYGVSTLSEWQQFKIIFGEWLGLRASTEKLSGWVYDGIDTWGMFLTKAHFRVIEEDENGNRKELRNHPFARLLKTPNPLQVGWTVKYRWAQHWGLWGSSYLRVIRGVGGKPLFLQQIPPHLIVPKTQGSRIWYEYHKVTGGTEEIPFQDIIPLHRPDPEKDLVGRAIVSSIADEVEVAKLQMEYAKKFYEEGGFLGLTFTTDQELTEASFERAKKMLEKEYAGKERAYKVGLFDGGLKPLPSAYSMRDMDIARLRGTTREEVLGAFKVPKILLGIGESINRATAEASIYSFASGVIDPQLSYVDDVFTRFVQSEYGENLMVMHDTVTPRDQEGDIKYYRGMAELGGYTINEMRREEGLNPFEGELAEVGIINLGGNAIRIDTGEIIGQQSEEPKKQDVEKSYNRYKSDVDDLRWKQFNRKHTYLSGRLQKRLNEYVEDQKRRIVEALKDNFVVEEAFNLSEEDVVLYQLLEIEIFEIMKQGYKYGAFAHDISPTGYNEENWGGIAMKLRNNVTLNSWIKDEIRGIKYDGDFDKALGELNNIYKDATTKQTPMISTTVVTGAMNAGILDAMRDAGLTYKIWLSMRDGKVRQRAGSEDHASMDGQKVLLDDYFEVPNRKGFDNMMFPGDPNGSPENIINDRCTIIGE